MYPLLHKIRIYIKWELCVKFSLNGKEACPYKKNSMIFFFICAFICDVYVHKGFPGGSDGKESACSAGDLGSIPGLGRSPREGNGYPLQYSCLENPMDRGAWWSTVNAVEKRRTWAEWRTLAKYYQRSTTMPAKLWPFINGFLNE